MAQVAALQGRPLALLSEWRYGISCLLSQLVGRPCCASLSSALHPCSSHSPEPLGLTVSTDTHLPSADPLAIEQPGTSGYRRAETMKCPNLQKNVRCFHQGPGFSLHLATNCPLLSPRLQDMLWMRSLGPFSCPHNHDQLYPPHSPSLPGPRTWLGSRFSILGEAALSCQEQPPAL